jgi:fructokinase
MSIDPKGSRPICVGLGEALWDLLPTGKALGGAAVNVAAHASQLGARGVLVSAVGNDAEGRELLRRLEELGVDSSHVQVRPDLPTGLVDVKLDASGIPSFVIRSPSAWDAITLNTDLERLADAADAVVFGSLAQRDPRSRKTICGFLHATRPGCLKVLDVNLRPPFVSVSVLRDSLLLANVLKLNDTELPVLAELLDIEGDETAQLQTLRDRFELEWVIYTRGDKGSRIVTDRRDETQPGCPATVIDTVGAGDAFTAAVTVGLLRGMELSRIQTMANRAASFVCSQTGAVPRLPEELAGAFADLVFCENVNKESDNDR